MVAERTVSGNWGRIDSENYFQERTNNLSDFMYYKVLTAKNPNLMQNDELILLLMKNERKSYLSK